MSNRRGRRGKGKVKQVRNRGVSSRPSNKKTNNPKSIFESVEYLIDKLGKGVQAKKYRTQLLHFLEAYSRLKNEDLACFMDTLSSRSDFENFVRIFRVGFLNLLLDSEDRNVGKFLSQVVSGITDELKESAQQFCILCVERIGFQKKNGKKSLQLLLHFLAARDTNRFLRFFQAFHPNQQKAVLEASVCGMNLVFHLIIFNVSEEILLKVLDCIEAHPAVDLNQMINTRSDSKEIIQKIYGYKNLSPWLFALKQGKIELAHVLLTRGAEFNVFFEEEGDFEGEIPGILLLLKTCAEKENFELYHEIKANYPEVVHHQLRSFPTARPSIELSDKTRFSQGNILHYLCEGCESLLNVSLVEFLIRNEPELLLERGTLRECTPVFLLLNRREWTLIDLAISIETSIFSDLAHTEQHFIDNQGNSCLYSWIGREWESMGTDMEILMDRYYQASNRHLWERRFGNDGWTLLAGCMLYGSSRRDFDWLVEKIKDAGMKIDPLLLDSAGEKTPFDECYYNHCLELQNNQTNILTSTVGRGSTNLTFQRGIMSLVMVRPFMELCLLYPEYINLHSEDYLPIIYSIVELSDYETLEALARNLSKRGDYIQIDDSIGHFIDRESPHASRVLKALFEIMQNQEDELIVAGSLAEDSNLFSLSVFIQLKGTTSVSPFILVSLKLSQAQVDKATSFFSDNKTIIKKNPDIKLLSDLIGHNLNGQKNFKLICQLLDFNINALYKFDPKTAYKGYYQTSGFFPPSNKKIKGRKITQPEETDDSTHEMMEVESNNRISPPLTIHFLESRVDFEEGCLIGVEGLLNTWVYVDEALLLEKGEGDLIDYLKEKHYVKGKNVTPLNYVDACLENVCLETGENRVPVPYKVKVPPKGDRIAMYALKGIGEDGQAHQILVPVERVEVHKGKLATTISTNFYPPEKSHELELSNDLGFF